MKKVVYARIDEELLRALKQRAQMDRRTLSNLIELTAYEYLYGLGDITEAGVLRRREPSQENKG
jgi:hypothetical protein